MMGNRNREATDSGVRVFREKLTACMTCPLCSELFMDATTIAECLHTFCRRCIHKSIIEEGSNRCPVCDSQLGCSPAEKLRPDHNMQYLVTKIFGHASPVHVNNVEDDSEGSMGPISCRRKEKLISSLVEDSTMVATKVDKRVKYARRRKQVAGRSEQQLDSNTPQAPQCRDLNNNLALEDDKADLWKPLSSLLEIGTESATQRAKKATDNNRPVWFSLIASDHQGQIDPLPQLPSSYLRVKDSTLRVSVIKKYLVQKLGLGSDSEVEIWLQDEPVETSLQLNKVIDRWLTRTSANTRTHEARVGTSAKDFVMVLSYGRKS